MDVAIGVIRPFHTVMMANNLRRHADRVGVWTSATRRFFRSLDPAVETHLIPSPIDISARMLHLRFSQAAALRGTLWWDRMVAMSLPRTDVFIGFASQSLYSGRRARRRGARYILDRACPHTDVQQALIREESERTGAVYEPQPAWFRDRQLAEYALAEKILVPSRYSAQSFPRELQAKLVLAPLLGRPSAKGAIRLERNERFTVGVLGGQPLRKGYIYLLEAWARLNLPNARLLIRSSADFSQFPKLREQLRSARNVELIEYLPNIAEFYAQCDAFVLPSVDDGFGMALFEAMANGVPVIATRNCGASELLTDGTDGLVVEARDTEGLAASMLALYQDEERRQAIARAGLETAARIAGSRMYEEALLQILPGRAANSSAA